MQWNEIRSDLVLSRDNIKFLHSEIKKLLNSYSELLISVGIVDKAKADDSVLYVNNLIYKFSQHLLQQRTSIDKETNIAINLFEGVDRYLHSSLLLGVIGSGTHHNDVLKETQDMHYNISNTNALERKRLYETSKEGALQKLESCFAFFKNDQCDNIQIVHDVMEDIKFFIQQARGNIPKIGHCYLDLLDSLNLAVRLLVFHNMNIHNIRLEKNNNASLTLEGQRKTGAICKRKDLKSSSDDNDLFAEDKQNNNLPLSTVHNTSNVSTIHAIPKEFLQVNDITDETLISILPDTNLQLFSVMTI